jgi:hypothetical protein
MAFKEIDEQGNITMYQGDTGHFNANGLNTDKNYYVYFAIQDENRNPIGNEIMVRSNFQTIAPFYIDQGLSNLLKVDREEEYHVYYYGIKVCTEEGDEDTMLIGNSKVGDLNTITVYPKKAEGR